MRERETSDGGEGGVVAVKVVIWFLDHAIFHHRGEVRHQKFEGRNAAERCFG